MFVRPVVDSPKTLIGQNQRHQARRAGVGCTEGKMTKYLLYIDDNFHYMRESERAGPFEFDTAEVALAEARRIVDRSLADSLRPGITAEKLYELYTLFGDDPFVVCDDPAVRGLDPALQGFSAWEYAKQRSKEMAPS